jgi:hypothetical protein
VHTRAGERCSRALGKAGFVEFERFGLGAALSKGRSQGACKSVRLLIGNPLIMEEMVRTVPDAGSYAPVTAVRTVRPSLRRRQ